MDIKKLDLERVKKSIDLPMAALSFIWLFLIIIELIGGLPVPLKIASTAIWVIFIFDLIFELSISKDKRRYIQVNWITVVSVILPAFRLFSLFRFGSLLRLTRFSRGIRLLRVFGSINRGITALAGTFGKGGVIYVFVLTIIVLISGAAGMYAFEKGQPGTSITSFVNALWWVSMMIITIGTDYWPKTLEGRILCFFLGLYGFSILGYITAILATYFLGLMPDKRENKNKMEISELMEEIKKLRAGLDKKTQKP